MPPAAEPRGNNRDCRDDGHVDQRVLHECDHRGRAQAARVRIGGQQNEGDGQRGKRVHRSQRAELAEDRPHSDELKGDVGQCRHYARESDRDLEPSVVVPVAHEVGGRDVAAISCDAPKLRKHDQRDGVGDRRVGDGKESERADAVNERGNGDEGVSGIEVAAEQKPRDDRSEAPPAQCPLLEISQVCAAPARREEAQRRYARLPRPRGSAPR